MKVKTNVKYKNNVTADIQVSLGTQEEYKKVLLSALNSDDSIPYFAVWFDKKRGFCGSIANNVKDSMIVRRGVLSTIKTLLENDL